jgi:hypothetical protein
MNEPVAALKMWWEHDGWRVVAHEPLCPDESGIPAISVQFDNLKLRKRAVPELPVSAKPRELELA